MQPARHTKACASPARHSLIITAATWRNSSARPSKRDAYKHMYIVKEMKGSHGRAATHLIICRETHNIISPRSRPCASACARSLYFLNEALDLFHYTNEAAMDRPGLTLMMSARLSLPRPDCDIKFAALLLRSGAATNFFRRTNSQIIMQFAKKRVSHFVSVEIQLKIINLVHKLSFSLLRWQQMGFYEFR